MAVKLRQSNSRIDLHVRPHPRGALHDGLLEGAPAALIHIVFGEARLAVATCAIASCSVPFSSSSDREYRTCPDGCGSRRTPPSRVGADVFGRASSLSVRFQRWCRRDADIERRRATSVDAGMRKTRSSGMIYRDLATERLRVAR